MENLRETHSESSKADKYNLPGHLAIYIFSSIAILLLLYEQSQLSSRAGVQADTLGQAMVQQSIMTVLLLGLLLPTYAWSHRRWAYALAAILFASYSGTRLAAAFSATLGLVPTLQAKGIPISDYQTTFYFLALAAAISYVLSILLLRKSYGRTLARQIAFASRTLHT